MARRHTTGAIWFEWQQRWHQSPESHDYMNRRVSLGVVIASDGSFRIDDVATGRLPAGHPSRGESYVSRRFDEHGRDSGPFLHISFRVFTVPPVPGGTGEGSRLTSAHCG